MYHLLVAIGKKTSWSEHAPPLTGYYKKQLLSQTTIDSLLDQGLIEKNGRDFITLSLKGFAKIGMSLNDVKTRYCAIVLAQNIENEDYYKEKDVNVAKRLEHVIRTYTKLHNEIKPLS